MPHNKNAAQLRISFAVKFTMIVMSAILTVIIAFTVMLSLNLSSVTYRQTEQFTAERMTHLRDSIVSFLGTYEELLYSTSLGISALFAQGDVSQDAMVNYLKSIAVRFPEMTALYYTNNDRWNSPEGFAAFSDDWIPDSDWNNTDRPWFIDAKNARGTVAYSVPYIDATTNDITISMSITVFDGNRRDVGVVATDILVNELLPLIHANLIVPEQKLFLLSGDGLFITNTNKSAIMSENFFSDPAYARFRSTALTANEFFTRDGDIFFFSERIPTSGWILVSSIPVSAIFGQTNRFVLQLIILGVVILMLVTCFSVLFIRKVLVVPLKEVKTVADSIASMDFGKGFDRFSGDELGDIQLSLTKIRDSLKKGIDDLEHHVSKAEKTGEQLNSVVVDSVRAIENITLNMNVMDDKVQSQMQSVKTASGAALEIYNHTYAFEETVQSQAESIQLSSKVIEGVVSNMNSIRLVVEDTKKTADVLRKSSEAGNRMLRKLSEELKDIEAQSLTLQNANKSISNIAAQTNILAMNAAIEAAHAGELGRGFAVVAGEVRKLAELSAKESDSISAEIKKMELVISQINAVSVNTVETMDAIFNGIKSMNDSFERVNSAVEEQSAGGTQMMDALRDVQKMTELVRSEAGVLHQHSSVINKDMENLNGISQEVTGKVNEIRKSGEDISSFLQSAKQLVS